jgi:hypothetical protein
MAEFERNVSTKTPRDIEAEGLVKWLDDQSREGEFINLDYPRGIERNIAKSWLLEGYGHLQAFSDKRGYPVIVARHEDAAMFDEEGVIKPDVDPRYRFYLEKETREVTVPRELIGKIAQSLDKDTVVLFDATEAQALELLLRDDADKFRDDIAWLKVQFGDSLKIVRDEKVYTRLETDAGVIAIALDNLSLFRESDF